MGIVSGIVSILFFPLLFGPVGIVLGVVGHRKGDPLGKTAAIVAGVCMLLGLILGFVGFALLSNANGG